MPDAPPAIHAQAPPRRRAARPPSRVAAARKKLVAQERIASSALDALGAPVLVLDGHGRIERFNDACEHLSGYSRAEVLGRYVWDVVIPPAEVDDVRAALSSTRVSDFPYSFENHWLTSAGELRLTRWQTSCLTDGKGAITHVVATGTDLTTSATVAVARQHELELMDALMDNVPNQIYFKDVESRFIWVSRSQAKALGVSDPSAAIGKTDFDFFTHEHAAKAFADEREIIRTGEPYNTVETETRAGWPVKWVMTTKLPWQNRYGRIIGTFGLSIDVTDRRSAEEGLRERERLFAALSEFSVAVNVIREPESLVAVLVDAVGTVVTSDTVAITMLDAVDGQYRVRAVRGLGDDAIGSIVERGHGTAGRAIGDRAMVATCAGSESQGESGGQDRVSSESLHEVAVPLVIEGTVHGVISVSRAGSDAHFTPAEREVLKLLGSHAALAFANALLVREVSALAIRDGLTGLFNRRHFDAALDLAIARWKRRGPAGNLAAIMFDLDHFGDFNRRHGHLAGDAALRLFGEILKTRLRSADVVARYGGEEFVAILDDCNLAEAARLADAVRRELQASSVPDARGRPIAVTVSAGCAVMDRAKPTMEALIGLADARLFAAKNSGRNRVVSTDDSPPRTRVDSVAESPSVRVRVPRNALRPRARGAHSAA